MGRAGRRTLIAAAVLLPLLGAKSASAQEDPLPQRTGDAGTRPQPEYDPIPLQLGSITVSPVARAGYGYDSNIFGLSRDPQGDGFFTLAPSIKLATDWKRHGVNLIASTNITKYQKFTNQNITEYQVRAAGYLDLADWKLSAGAGLGRTAERHGDNGTPLGLGTPSLYRLASQSVDLSRQFAAISFQVSGNHTTTTYSDLVVNGAPVSQAFRNSEQWAVSGKAVYTSTSAAAIGLSTSYEHATARSPVSRTNDTLTVQGVVAVDFGMVRLSARGGYLSHRFSNPLFRDFNGFVYHGEIYWYLVPMLTVSARARKSLENSGVSTVGSIVTQSIAGGADYELLRNFVLHAQISRRHDRFPEIGASAVSNVQELKGEFRFNHSVAIEAYGRHLCKASSVAGGLGRYCAAVLGLSISIGS